MQHGRITWTDVIHITPDDVESLRMRFPDFHPLDLEDLLSHIERPKLDQYDEYLFTVMHFPIWDAVRQINRPSEVDLFVGANYVVTVHDGALRPITTLFERCWIDESVRELYMGQSASRLFYTVIDQLVDYIFPILYKVDSSIHDIEEEIFTRDTRRLIRDIAMMRRDNIALRRILRPQIEILQTLENVERPFMREDLEVYFGDIRDHLLRAVDQISDHAEVIVSLSDTLNTLASYRTNEIVHILTVISVVLLPLTLLSGIYGMNVPLPFEEHPLSFFIVITLMIFTAMGMIFFFRWRGWL